MRFLQKSESACSVMSDSILRPECILRALDTPRDWAVDFYKLLQATSAPSPQVDPFQSAGDSIVLVQPNIAHAIAWQHTFGATAFAGTILGKQWGGPPAVEDRVEVALADLLVRLEERKFPHSVSRLSRGGLATGLVLSCRPRHLGVHVNLGRPESESALQAYFGEEPSRLLLTCKGHAHFALSNFIEYGGRFIATAIGKVTDGEFVLEWERKEILTTRLKPAPTFASDAGKRDSYSPRNALRASEL